MQTTERKAVIINRRSDYGATLPKLNDKTILVDASIGDPPKKWQGADKGDPIKIKIDQVHVANARVDGVILCPVWSDSEFQNLIHTITDPESGNYASFEYIGKLTKMLRTAQRKNIPLCVNIVVSTVTDIV